MKVFIYLTLLLGVIRAVSDYAETQTNPEKVGVLIVIGMFISSLILTYRL